jgi:hypothetical protein
MIVSVVSKDRKKCDEGGVDLQRRMMGHWDHGFATAKCNAYLVFACSGISTGLANPPSMLLERKRRLGIF